MRTKVVCAALLIVSAVVGLVGCNCDGACALATAKVTQSAAVVKVVADPPCTAQVYLVDAGVQLVVSPQVPNVSGDVLSCQIYEWLSNGAELTAQASFKPGDGPCCSNAFQNGTLSSFVPPDGGAP